MKQNVISLTDDAEIVDALRLCKQYHIGTLPIVDREGRLVGSVRMKDLISLGMPDFMRFIENIDFIHSFGAMEAYFPGKEVLSIPITKVMTEAVSVQATTGLLRAAALLHKHQLNDIPVVDDQNRLVGLASHVDIGVALLDIWLSKAQE
jgi:IMP dehydrogenase